MPAEPMPLEPRMERRQEIFYGTPGTIIYKDNRPVLWIPDDFGSLTKNLRPEDLKALWRELTKYLGSPSPDGRVT
jgi:hypothetical protein